MPLTCFEMTQNYRANMVMSVVKVGKESLFQFYHSTCTGVEDSLGSWSFPSILFEIGVSLLIIKYINI